MNKIANLKESQHVITGLKTDCSVSKFKEVKENFSAKFESVPKRSFNVEGNARYFY